VGLFRKDPASVVDKMLATMAAQIAANERDNIGLLNRPRYVSAQQSIVNLGTAATPHLLQHLERLESAARGSTEKDLADDITELLGKLHDPAAVPKLASLLHGDGIWTSVSVALTRTPEGTQVLLDATRSPEATVRARALHVWLSDHRRADVTAALAAGLGDPDAYVRNEAVSAVMGAERRDEPIVAALRQMLSSDPSDRLRDRADSALRRLGIAV
jgi:hypothetical protein